MEDEIAHVQAQQRLANTVDIHHQEAQQCPKGIFNVPALTCKVTNAEKPRDGQNDQIQNFEHKEPQGE
ncbi:MAG: hypothetical protein CMF62_12080 [Magnetococcales bacterium]|nr:hypothetical protein [Magnetococcales bacterium]